MEASKSEAKASEAAAAAPVSEAAAAKPPDAGRTEDKTTGERGSTFLMLLGNKEVAGLTV